MVDIDLASLACGAAVLPFLWAVTKLVKTRRNAVATNDKPVPGGYKVNMPLARKSAVHQAVDTLTNWSQVVITGGSKGLGYALAERFLSVGDHVVIAARTSNTCEAAAHELQQQHPGQQVLHTTCDVSQPDQVQQLAAFARSKLGQVDIWVNNAGMSQIPKAPLADTSAEQVQQIIQTNMCGALLGCQAAVQVMRDQKTGGKVFLLDGAGSRGTATAKSATYGATKAAMPQLLRSLAAEVNASSVSVHLASPGMVATDLLLKGVSGPSAAKIVNILAEEPKVVAAWLVPRMRGVTGNGKYFKYLTAAGVLWRFLTARSRKGRFLAEGVKQA